VFAYFQKKQMATAALVPELKSTAGIAPFIASVWNMLASASNFGSDYIRWYDDGTGFLVVHGFSEHVLPTYFNTTRFESFCRMITSYAFKQFVDHHGRTHFSHPHFRRDSPTLLTFIDKTWWDSGPPIDDRSSKTLVLSLETKVAKLENDIATLTRRTATMSADIVTLTTCMTTMTELNQRLVQSLGCSPVMPTPAPPQVLSAIVDPLSVRIPMRTATTAAASQ